MAGRLELRWVSQAEGSKASLRNKAHGETREFAHQELECL